MSTLSVCEMSHSQGDSYEDESCGMLSTESIELVDVSEVPEKHKG